MRVKYLCFVLLWLLPGVNSLSAQEMDTLILSNYLELIGNNHPLIKKAELFDAFVEAYDMKARGTFDPKLFSSFDRKQFDDKRYFTTWNTEAKIPTNLPIDFSVGYENNSGLFLNPESSLPENGLIYGTLNLSLIRGLLFDEQRFKVQMAELKGLKSEIEKEILVREIIYQALVTYVDWVATNNKSEVIEQTLVNIREQHQNTVQLFLDGDKPAIDTIESRINLNSAEKDYLELQLELGVKRQKVNLFLWDNEMTPLILLDGVSPQRAELLAAELESLGIMLSPDFSIDPKIRKLLVERESLSLENRLTKEKLKPQFDLKYNTILRTGTASSEPSISLNDYKYGVQFEMPLRNRSTKSDLHMNDILMEQILLDQRQQIQKFETEYDLLLENKMNQESILSIVEEKIQNCQVLYEAELLKYGIGESSVFLLNKRQEKLLEAQNDKIKIQKMIHTLLSDLYYLKMGQA